MTGILLSFCIPVMNRLADLQATLGYNLEDNRAQNDRVEFVINCFDEGMATAEWIRANFGEDLATGYLRFNHFDYLPQWHFGRAKNSFRGIAKGRIYTSLDSDNFTGPAGGQHIIDVFEAIDYNCIFHQFQGDWGDGTCGRVSMPMLDYERIGYDARFLPRQWDELDAILSTIVQNPSRKYVCYEGKSIVEKSGPFRRFIEENKIPIQTIEVPVQRDPLYQTKSDAAVGQQNSSYVQDDDRLRLSSVFNHLSSCYKNTESEDLLNQYVSELVDVQRSMAECLELSLLLEWFLMPQWNDTPQLDADDILLVSCIRNEVYLEDWLDYYRALGVTHFLLVDDDSDTPISERIVAEDIWVWKPMCGKFRYSKAFWLELLLRRYGDGFWVLTVDSDEYLELPVMNAGEGQKHQLSTNSLQQLLGWADTQNISYFAGFLLDMVPGPGQLPKVEGGDPLEMKDFCRYQFRPFPAKPPYLRYNTVKWSYGDSAEWAYRIDIRFRLNRAFESLRKFPVFKMGSDIHLNQGFHDLLIAGEKRKVSEMKRLDLLVIRHFNLLGVHHKSTGAVLRPVDAYHQETQTNIERLQNQLKKALKIAAMSPFTFQYINPQLVPVPGRDHIIISRLTDVKEAMEPYVDVLNRTSEISLVISNINPVFQNGLLKARSIQEAALWCIQATPFNEIVELNDSHAVLCVAGGLETKNCKTDYKLLTGSWLSGGSH